MPYTIREIMPRETAQAIVDAVSDPCPYNSWKPTGDEYEHAIDDLQFYEHQDAQDRAAWMAREEE